MKTLRPLLFLLLAVAPPAGAVDTPLLGKTLRLRDTMPGKRSVAFVLTGAVDLTGVDPTQDGCTVTVSNGGSYTVTLSLPAADWKKAKGKSTKPPTYKYVAHDGATGSGVVAVLKAGTLVKVSAHGPLLPALGGPLGSVSVSVDAGTLHLCALFGGKLKKDDGKKFLAAKAPAPDACGSTTTTIPPCAATTSSTARIRS